MPTLELTSPSFENNSAIPSRFTCDGDGKNPELHINGVDEGAKSLVLIMDDPDSPNGTWIHWILFNLPPNLQLIKEGTEPSGSAGKNTWGNVGYGAPCPHNGEHRYFFKLYSLNDKLDLPQGVEKKELDMAMDGNVIQQTELVGTYTKIKQ